MKARIVVGLPLLVGSLFPIWALGAWPMTGQVRRRS